MKYDDTMGDPFLEREVLIWTPTDGRLVRTSTEAELDAPPASVS
jgi:hypothetical protein